MDFAFTADEAAFRAEVRAFLRDELGEDFHDTGYAYRKDWSFERAYMKKLAAKRWLTPAWPPEHGGLGLGVMKQTIFEEEMYYGNSPHFAISANGVDLVGPILMIYGSEEQKREQLPLISSGQRIWAQGFTEPNAGSDLASLQTRAAIDGDDFVINGTKIFTSYGHVADWMFILTRTDPDAPKHRGISFLIFDMKQPGVTVRHLVDMAGEHMINQEFFENVRVPRENLVGELNRGWYIAAALLDFERSGIRYAATCRRRLDDLVRICRDAPGRRSLTPIRRARIAERYVEVEACRLLAYRVASMQDRGLVPNMEASVAKLFGSELQQRVAETAIRVLGPYGHLMEGPRAPRYGDYARYAMNYVVDTVGGGSNEIQRNIIATRGLGLPRM